MFAPKTYVPHFGTTVLLFIDYIINIAMDGHFLKVLILTEMKVCVILTLFVKHKLDLPNCVVDITAFMQINMRSHILMFY